MRNFIIDHIDPLGQGVYKKDGEIYFIPKTLPGEIGKFKITKSRKGVHFGQLISLDQESPNRVESPCPHFDICPGCHYLHTSYQEEISFKRKNFEKVFQKIQFDFKNLKIIRSPSRLHYRNRIQLHYNRKLNLIGFMGKNNKIIPVPKCKLPNEVVEHHYQVLLENWQSLAPKSPPKGHVEIYELDGEVKISWNRPYADGGFTQVNKDTNKLMLEEIKNYFNNKEINCLDLFGGKGNLSNDLNCKSRTCIDIYRGQVPGDEFTDLDLYKEDSLDRFRAINTTEFDTLIIDPPRSGFKYFSQWISEVKPQNIIYVSCHPATMARDLTSLPKEFQVSEFWLVDLFPSTFHFESVAIIKYSA